MEEKEENKGNETSEYQKVYFEEKAKLDAKKEFEEQKKKETKSVVIKVLRYIISIFLIVISFLSFLGSFITPDINIVQIIIMDLILFVIGILELPPLIEKIETKKENDIMRKYIVIILIIAFFITSVIS